MFMLFSWTIVSPNEYLCATCNWKASSRWRWGHRALALRNTQIQVVHSTQMTVTEFWDLFCEHDSFMRQTIRQTKEIRTSDATHSERVTRLAHLSCWNIWKQFAETNAMFGPHLRPHNVPDNACQTPFAWWVITIPQFVWASLFHSSRFKRVKLESRKMHRKQVWEQLLRPLSRSFSLHKQMKLQRLT